MYLNDRVENIVDGSIAFFVGGAVLGPRRNAVDQCGKSEDAEDVEDEEEAEDPVDKLEKNEVKDFGSL
jgi:hypothetical protein